MQQLPLGVRHADRAVFQSYFPGPNREALEALRALVGSPVGGILFLWGGEGSGKSHLLQATCAAIAGSAYLPLAQLQAAGPGALEGADFLSAACIDDLDCCAGQSEWERGLFRVYCDAQAHGGKLVLAARHAPAALAIRLPDLASRLAGSNAYSLRMLDEPQQREALQLRAQLRGLTLPDETAHYLQRRFARDMGTLYRLLDTLDTAALSAQRRLTVPFIREVLRPRS